jgi:hypothetical protein
LRFRRKQETNAETNRIFIPSDSFHPNLCLRSSHPLAQPKPQRPRLGKPRDCPAAMARGALKWAGHHRGFNHRYCDLGGNKKQTPRLIGFSSPVRSSHPLAQPKPQRPRLGKPRDCPAAMARGAGSRDLGGNKKQTPRLIGFSSPVTASIPIPRTAYSRTRSISCCKDSQPFLCLRSSHPLAQPKPQRPRLGKPRDCRTVSDFSVSIRVSEHTELQRSHLCRPCIFSHNNATFEARYAHSP